eukprot:jgi/Mesvir1/3647/Mv14942-RA.2
MAAAQSLTAVEEALSAMNMSSPDAGADLAAIKAQLERISESIRSKEQQIGSAADGGVVPFSTYTKRTVISKVLSPEGISNFVDKTVVVGGWVKTGREQGKGAFAFLEVNDGSCPTNLQVMVESSVHNLSELTPTGTSVLVEGVLKKTPEGVKQPVELKVAKVLHVGLCDATVYPIAKTKLSLEFLRTQKHMRCRTNTIAAVTRIRNALAHATHSFFQSNGFIYLHTPIITASDCEGAGEMFQVTTLLNSVDKPNAAGGPPPAATPEALEAQRAAVAAQGEAVKSLKASSKDKGEIKAAVDALLAAKGQLGTMEEAARTVGGIVRTPEGTIDYSKDFFSKASYLTVSGQLEAEIYACAMGRVYTFGPTFRAENSHTTRHLAEFWMIEPEIAFADLQDDMACAEDYVKFCCRHLLQHCMDDLQFFAKMYDEGCIARLQGVAEQPFVRLSYTEAVDVLLKADKQFEVAVEWGIDLQSEHERYLTEVVYQKPVILYNYPKAIKAFYMRANDDGKTVAAMDVLVPRVGELIGGSQREERADVLRERWGTAPLGNAPGLGSCVPFSTMQAKAA